MWEEELAAARRLAEEASAAIMRIYRSGEMSVVEKGDGSPLTQADLASNRIIVAGLRKVFPEDGILTEEEADDPSRLSKRRVWIIDPIDGTKEFISRNGEFTVNIALVLDGDPVLGVVAVPAKGETFFAVSGQGAFKEHGETTRITASTKAAISQMTLVASRSHRGPADEAFAHHFMAMRPAGSSLKGCLVASGEADAYLRSGPVNEWDICAMDTIIRESGAKMTNLTGAPIVYNQEETLRHGFLVSNGRRHKELLGLL